MGNWEAEAKARTGPRCYGIVGQAPKHRTHTHPDIHTAKDTVFPSTLAQRQVSPMPHCVIDNYVTRTSRAYDVVAVLEPGLNPYLKIPKHTRGGDYHIVWGWGRAVLYVQKRHSVAAWTWKANEDWCSVTFGEEQSAITIYSIYSEGYRLSIHKPYGYGKSIWNFHMDMDCIDIWITYGHTEINLASGYNTAFQTWASRYTSSH